MKVTTFATLPVKKRFSIFFLSFSDENKSSIWVTNMFWVFKVESVSLHFRQFGLWVHSLLVYVSTALSSLNILWLLNNTAVPTRCAGVDGERVTIEKNHNNKCVICPAKSRW